MVMVEFQKELLLIAIFQNKIVRHILFFPTKIVNKMSLITLALATMSVFPEFHVKGIGSKLVTRDQRK